MIVFITKAGKASHSKPKDYSLLSFLLKTLEQLIDLYLRTTIDSNFVNRTKLTYIMENFVESALHDDDSNIWDVTSHDDKYHARCVIRMGIMG